MEVWRAAEAAGGRVLLRLEDVDVTRCRPEFETAIYEDLAWLGFEWETPVRRQSAHFEDYAAVVDALRRRGLVYRCFMTRTKIAELNAGGPDAGFVSGPLPPAEEAAKLDAGEAFAWRLSLSGALAALGDRAAGLGFIVGTERGEEAVQARPEMFGDIALTRKDSPAAYHLAACHDDALQGVTHVIRGEDLINAPHIQCVLQAVMGWPTPRYRHHKLLTGPDGKRFSKSDRSKTVAAMRDEGMSAEEIRALASAA